MRRGEKRWKEAPRKKRPIDGKDIRKTLGSRNAGAFLALFDGCLRKGVENGNLRTWKF
jgi:hypothetical protein